MNRPVRLALWVLGACVAAAFLREMLGHYGAHGGRYAGNWAQPATLPAALSNGVTSRLADSLTLTMRPHAGERDSVYTTDVTIANRSGSPVRDVAISCDAIGVNGETAGHAATTLHHGFLAHATTTEANVELHFIHRPTAARCAIADFVIGP